MTLTVGRISTRRQVNGSMATAAPAAAIPSPIQLSSIGHSLWERAITMPMVTSGGARRRPRDGAMVGEGGQRMAELLRRADQFPGPSRLRTASGVYLAQDLAPAVPADTDDDSRCSPPPRGAILAPCAGQAPLAYRAICRQPPKVGAVCVNAHVRICAGGPGQPGSLPRRCAVTRMSASAC